jgi:outer membrane protein assembly factor BamB
LRARKSFVFFVALVYTTPMHSMSSLRLVALSILLSVSGISRAADWPQWLGPNRDSIWRETDILDRFPTNGPPVRWRTAIGAGYSAPSVANGRVYVTDRQRTSETSAGTNASPHSLERVLCLNEADGKLLWHYDYDCPYSISYSAGPRAAPLVNDGKVYTFGAEADLVCLNAQSGKLVWALDFKKEFGITAPTWGFAGHPLLDGNRLICMARGDGSTVVALDKDTGKEVWRAVTAAEPGYSSPIILEAAGKRQLIVLEPEAVNSLDPQSGQLYWSVPFTARSGLTVATPRKLGDLLFVTSFYNGAMMLRLDSAQPKATSVWRTEKVSERETTHLNAILCTPFLEDGYIYGVCSYGQLRCLKAATGERVWETFEATTSDGPVRWANAFLVKNGNRFFLFNEKGDLIIARLSPAGYEEISRAHLLEPTNKDCGRLVVWCHPAFANRSCYVRNDREIVCVNLARR